jgi:hypothetical protein
MATLLFSALGTLLGGPLGGVIGALAGQQVDRAIIGSPNREGPRLKELSVTTSSYGTPLPRHYGRMRVAGSIIWATDLIEHREKQGGGKGRPSVTAYSYTASFAVALASRPVQGIGRIWADGNLLRGAAGDLKSSGSFRFYAGQRDQAPDPLIAAAEGAGRCPAFRGLSYVVFEDLELGDFGNRIPALTFEIFADDGALSLATLFADTLPDVDADLPLPGIAGLSCEGALAETLALLDPVFPMGCDASGDQLVLVRERLQTNPIALPEAATATGDSDFGGGSGYSRRRAPMVTNPPEILRYYDVDRDYQPGLQRAVGRPSPGQPRSIELPAALAATDARRLADGAARRVGWSRQTLSWRSCQLDPRIAPGAIVTAPGLAGRWRVSDWEWRESGVELSLLRLGPETAADLQADAGRANLPPDAANGPSAITAFELPWDGNGAGDTPAIFAAVSSAANGWSGAALFVDQGEGSLAPIGPSGRTRSTMGRSINALPAASPMLFDRKSSVIVELLGDDMLLSDATPGQLAMGANRALLGTEIFQFGKAIPLGNRQWRLEKLLRGRGGSEGAISGHQTGEAFVLLDAAAVTLDASLIGDTPGTLIAAVGLGDAEPVLSSIAGRGMTLRPLTPVHPSAVPASGGGLALGWTRRSRGAWLWPDGVDAPLHEQSEAYDITYGPINAPLARWEVSEPRLVLGAATLAELAALQPGETLRVRQRGSYAVSDPLVLAQLT